MTPAIVPALLYLIGITAWAAAQWTSNAEAIGYFVLIALILPWWFFEAKDNPYRPRPVIFAWAFALLLPYGVTASLHDAFDLQGVWMLLSGAIAAALFLAGRRFWGEGISRLQQPLQTLGALAVVVLALVFSFEDVWRSQMRDWTGGASAFRRALSADPIAFAIAGLWLLLWLALLVDSLRFKDWARSLLGALPIFVALGLVLTRFDYPLAAMLFLNVYLFALGLGTLLAGLREQSLGRVNSGMLILAALILSRFFDADIGFIARGLAFIALGAGFLIVNLAMIRRRGAAQP